MNSNIIASDKITESNIEEDFTNELEPISYEELKKMAAQ
jgi:hypothetical protein